MRIAVAGKGGVGKTTLAAVVARRLADDGHRVLAIDADTDPNLGISLGLGVEETDRLIAAREALDEEPDSEHATTAEEVVRRFGADAPGGIRLVQVSKVDRPDPG